MEGHGIQNLLEVQSLWPYPRLTEAQSLIWDLATGPEWFDCMLNFKTHWQRSTIKRESQYQMSKRTGLYRNKSEMSSRYPGKGKDWRKGIPTQATYTIHSRLYVHTWMHAATHTSHTPTNPHILHKASTTQHGAGFITFSNADKILMKQWLKETINYFPVNYKCSIVY